MNKLISSSEYYTNEEFINELKKKFNLNLLNLDFLYKSESQDHITKGLHSFIYNIFELNGPN